MPYRRGVRHLECAVTASPGRSPRRVSRSRNTIDRPCAAGSAVAAIPMRSASWRVFVSHGHNVRGRHCRRDTLAHWHVDARKQPIQFGHPEDGCAGSTVSPAAPEFRRRRRRARPLSEVFRWVPPNRGIAAAEQCRSLRFGRDSSRHTSCGVLERAIRDVLVVGVQQLVRSQAARAALRRPCLHQFRLSCGKLIRGQPNPGPRWRGEARSCRRSRRRQATARCSASRVPWRSGACPRPAPARRTSGRILLQATEGHDLGLDGLRARPPPVSAKPIRCWAAGATRTIGSPVAVRDATVGVLLLAAGLSSLSGPRLHAVAMTPTTKAGDRESLD